MVIFRMSKCMLITFFNRKCIGYLKCVLMRRTKMKTTYGIIVYEAEVYLVAFINRAFLHIQTTMHKIF